MAACAWAESLHWGRIVSGLDSETSWVTVMTYAIARRWQFGKEMILTYGPAMPLLISSFSGIINTAVVASEMLFKAWLCVLLIWLGDAAAARAAARVLGGGVFALRHGR